MDQITAAKIIQKAQRSFLSNTEKCDFVKRIGIWQCNKRFIPDLEVDYGAINDYMCPKQYHCNNCLCICLQPNVDDYLHDVCNMCNQMCCIKCGRGCICCEECGRVCQYH